MTHATLLISIYDLLLNLFNSLEGRNLLACLPQSGLVGSYDLLLPFFELERYRSRELVMEVMEGFGILWGW